MLSCDAADSFSEVFARKSNFVTGLDARTKLGFTVAALAVNLLSPGILTPVNLAVFSLSTLLLVRVPARLLLLRMAMPLAMAVVILLTQIFLYGDTVLFSVPVWGLSLTGYVEGLGRGLLIMCRAIGGVSLVLLLSMSTPADQLFRAAAWFRVPRTLTELALLVYRYIFVLVEEFAVMKDARRVRLGFHGWRLSMKSFSMLGACLILRAYDRAERVFEAMSVRGYGVSTSGYAGVFTRKDGLAAACLCLVLAAFWMIGWTTA